VDTPTEVKEAPMEPGSIAMALFNLIAWLVELFK